MIKVFITGATGQVGHELVRYLLETNKLGIKSPKDIICLVRTPQKAVFLQEQQVTIIQGNIHNRDLLNNIFLDFQPDYVFHIAANIYVYASYEEMIKDNYIGTKNVLDAFVLSRSHTFIYASSIVVYDHKNTNGNQIEFTEDMKIGKIHPSSDLPYSISKRKAEKLMQKYQQKFLKKHFSIARLSLIVGPYDRQFLPRIVQIFHLPIPKLVDKGNAKINLTSSRDCARALIFLAEKNHKTQNEVFNVANKPISFYEIFAVFAHYYQLSMPCISIPKEIVEFCFPLFNWIQKIFKNNELIQTIFSGTTIEYLTHSYSYNSQKIQKLGFVYEDDVRFTILQSLKTLDPVDHYYQEKR